MRRRLSGMLCGVALAACSVVSPPPLFPTHATAAPEEPGTVSVALVTGLGAGVFTDHFAGGEIRIEWQKNARTALGLGIGGGGNLSSERPARNKGAVGGDERDILGHLFAVRGYARYFPKGRENIAFGYGAGLGIGDSGLSYLTVHGTAVAGTADGVVDVYVAPVVALSIPITRGRALSEKSNPGCDEPAIMGMPPAAPLPEPQWPQGLECSSVREIRPALTLYFGGDLGVVADSDGTRRASLGLGTYGAVPLGGESAVLFQGSLGGRGVDRPQPAP